jgi:hypothetical protein
MKGVEMALIAKNDIARTVLDHLPGSYESIGGFYGGQAYCIGVQARSVADAFELGRNMGAEAKFGDIGFNQHGNKALVVFRDAHVMQGPAPS